MDLFEMKENEKEGDFTAPRSFKRKCPESWRYQLRGTRHIAWTRGSFVLRQARFQD